MSEEARVDPLIAGGLAAAKVAATDSEASKATWSLIGRVLGPAADEYGAHLAERVASWRAANAQKLAEKAAGKAADREGTVPPRVAYRILDDGSLTDDDVAVEYLSGMLASTRTPSGKDDRALVWSDLVGRMSTLQIRAHYLLYREWALELPATDALNMGVDAGRRQAELHTPLVAFGIALSIGSGIAFRTVDDLLSLVAHAIPGLARLGLIDNDYQYGPRSREDESPFDVYVRVRPSVAGLELFAAAAGTQVLPNAWPGARLSIEAEPPVPRLADVAFPLLPTPDVR